MTVRLVCLFISVFSLLPVFATNRALVIGIGSYDTHTTGWGRIHGDADVDMLSRALQNQGFLRENIFTLKNQEATKKNIVANIKKLADVSRSGDNVFFIFSGHGQLVKNFNNDTEKNDVDESIVPYDAYKTGRYKYNGGFYSGENHLLDDEIAPLLDAIKIKIGVKGTLLVAIDACYSQGMEQDGCVMFSAEDMEIMGPIRGTVDVFKPKSEKYLKLIPVPKKYSKGGQMIILSACKYNERNFEYKDPVSGKIMGSLSHCISLLLKDDINFKRWIKYFVNKEYEGKKLFMPSQHPTIKVYD